MEISHESIGETLFDLTLYAAAIHANPSPRLEGDKVKTTLDTCGLGYERPLADYDPDTQSWRMFGDTYLWGESPLLENLPPSGMTRNGVLYQQPAWVPITDETASSLLPTPTASEHKYRLQGDSQQSHCLEAMARRGELTMWPTPTAVTRPMEGNVRLYRAKVEAEEMTEAEAQAILGKSVWEAHGKLQARWPTPTAADSYTHNLRSTQQTEGSRHSLNLPSAAGGQLNPTWVEWLMGFPPGWTDLED